jgi:hypothetical protein
VGGNSGKCEFWRVAYVSKAVQRKNKIMSCLGNVEGFCGGMGYTTGVEEDMKEKKDMYHLG